MKENIIKNHEEREKAEKIRQQVAKSLTKEDVPELEPAKGLIHLPDEIMQLKKKNKCAIIGFAGSWYQAPWQDESFDIWGINELYKFNGEEAKKHRVKPRYDVWFEIHNIKDSPSKQKEDHQKFLKQCPYPLVTQKHWDEYPSSIKFPRAEIKEAINKCFITNNEIGSEFTDYSNQISWMTALAIYMGYEEIHIYGVDMAANTEYNFQRASCQFFIGLAAGLGVRLLIPKSSELCKHYCDYGFESDNAGRFRVKDRIKNINTDIGNIDKRLAEIAFYKDKLDKDLLAQSTIINNTIQELKQERAKTYAILEANKGLLSFLASSPATLDEYLSKRGEVLVQVQEINKQNEQVLDNIAKEINNQILNRENEEKKVFMNKKMLENEEEMLKAQMASRQGIIGENKHLLNNNLI